jgi:2-C-methyl-D-erythritol 4-phosphate cytidylyltransferase/2-C-methyl-D-erythritol 2,4-cyclodiphosphate synthase
MPKQYRLLAGKPVLRRTCEAFLPFVPPELIRVVIADGDAALFAEATDGLGLPLPVTGGATRQQSVRQGLEALADAAPDNVLIHDAARPLVPGAVITRVLDALAVHEAACPVLAVADSLRTGDAVLTGEVSRDGLWRAQTPQGFRFEAIRRAHTGAAEGATDDAAVAMGAGMSVAPVEGDEMAMKLTAAEDFARAEAMLPARWRTGTGFDVHVFGPGDHLWLCGVRLEHSHGLIGHSDADVGLHAITDAVLGAISAGDIGQHFPPSDERWRGASSDRFLAHAASLVAARGGRIEHVDVTVITEAPKVGPHRAAMAARIAEILAEHGTEVSVKATTTEGVGFTGRREGIAAQAAASVVLRS